MEHNDPSINCRLQVVLESLLHPPNFFRRGDCSSRRGKGGPEGGEGGGGSGAQRDRCKREDIAKSRECPCIVRIRNIQRFENSR